jgi:hypothetical protein
MTCFSSSGVADGQYRTLGRCKPPKVLRQPEGARGNSVSTLDRFDEIVRIHQHREHRSEQPMKFTTSEMNPEQLTVPACQTGELACFCSM